jgi:hypothetical protein
VKGAGVILGVLFGWGAVVAVNESGFKLAQYRALAFNEDLGDRHQRVVRMARRRP